MEIAIIKEVHAGGVFVKTGISERIKGAASVKCSLNWDMKLAG